MLLVLVLGTSTVIKTDLFLECWIINFQHIYLITFQEMYGQHLSHVSCYTNTFMSKIFLIFFINHDEMECCLAVVPMTTLKDILDNETVVYSKV